MVDTGATSSLITMSTIIKLNYQDEIYKQEGEIILGDSKTKIIRYGWIYLNMKINNLDCGIPAMIVDNLTVDFILGMDFMKKFKVDIKTTQECLVIRHRQRQIYVKFEKPNSVRLNHQCTILPRSKRVVDATISSIVSADNMLLNVIDENIQRYKRIRLCDGLVDIKNNNVQVTIYNPTKKLVTLPQSMFLGTRCILFNIIFKCNQRGT